MDKLIKIHHSLVDWNFQANTNWFISPEQYVSAPSSLARPNEFYTTTSGRFALKQAISGNLKEGRAITYHRTQRADCRNMTAWVRAQTSPHLGNPIDSYIFEFNYQLVYILKIVAGSTTLLAQAPCPFTWNINTWYRFRLTWYDYLNAQLVNTLRLVIEYEQDGAWLPWLFVDDDAPSWEDSETNLIGFYAENGYTALRTYIDNTEIWRKAT